MEEDISLKKQMEAKKDEMDIRENIIALQKYEKMLSSIMYTKERIIVDLKGINVAMEQLEKKPKEVYRFYGPILLKKTCDEVEKEFEEEKEGMLLKQKQIIKQEDSLKKMYNELRQKVIEQQKEIKEKYTGK